MHRPWERQQRANGPSKNDSGSWRRSMILAAILCFAALFVIGCGGDAEGEPSSGPLPSESAIASDVSFALRLLPNGAQRLRASSRGFERTESGFRARTPETGSTEAWLSVEASDASPETLRYRYRNSPHLWVSITNSGDSPAPLSDVQGPALVGASDKSGRFLLASKRTIEEFWRVEAPDGVPSLEFNMKVGPGIVDVAVNDSGDVVISDAAGTARFVIRRPVAFDSDGVERQAAWRISSTDDNSAFALSTELDVTGLAFPILIDPTVEIPTWIQKNPVVHPSVRMGSGMTFDTARERTVLFGGQGPNGYGPCFADTWEWDGTTWHNATGGTAPEARQRMALAYHPVAGRAILFGGSCGGETPKETWGWNGSSWTILPAGTPPTGWGYDNTGADYDSERGVVVMFGYQNPKIPTSVFEYTAGAGWSHITASPGPESNESRLFFDSALNRSIVFTWDSSRQTWGWNGANWVQYTASGAPATRQNFAMVWDSDRQVGVLYGGQDGCCTRYYDTYEWYGYDWHLVTTSTHPTSHRNGAMTYDPVRQEIVYFGGHFSTGSSTNTVDETWVYKVLHKLTDGESCSQAGDCLNGYCVDGVCCNSSCGAGVANDCRACSVATGAAVDGICGAVSSAMAIECRASSGPCDQAEVCNGTSTSCPVNAYSAAGSVCRDATGPCDVAETCTGTSASCPADAFATATTVCRAKSGDCDIEEHCSGASASCPADTVAASGTTCRATAGNCDEAEHCDGTSKPCPADMVKPAGTACRAAAGPCDLDESCTGSSANCPADSFVQSGTVCRAAANACDVAEVCSGATAPCPVDAFASDGTDCDDQDACSQTDSCQAGACVGGDLISCPPPTACHETATCNPQSGACDSQPSPDGSICDDSDACTVSDSCQSGACVPGAPIDCDDGDACTEDGCDSSTGCVHTPIAGCADAGADAGGAGGSSGSDASPDAEVDAHDSGGAGGTSGSAGTGGTGGSPGADAGVDGSLDSGSGGTGGTSEHADAAPGSGTDSDSDEGSGCGCRIKRKGDQPDSMILLLGLAALALSRRTKRRATS